MHPFAPRPIEPLGVDQRDGWSVKLYSIAVDAARVDREEFEPGLRLALAALPQPARAPDRPGVAFCILHRGRGADYVVLGWWDRENELPVRVFIRTAEEVGWREARGSESFCVWDLQVVGFERDAYVHTLLADPPLGVDAYLSRVLALPAPVAVREVGSAGS